MRRNRLLREVKSNQIGALEADRARASKMRRCNVLNVEWRIKFKIREASVAQVFEAGFEGAGGNANAAE